MPALGFFDSVSDRPRKRGRRARIPVSSDSCSPFRRDPSSLLSSVGRKVSYTKRDAMAPPRLRAAVLILFRALRHLRARPKSAEAIWKKVCIMFA